MLYRCVGYAPEVVGAHPDLFEKGRLISLNRRIFTGTMDGEIDVVEVLPHLRRNGLPDRAGIFAGRRDARENRIRILRVERQKFEHRIFGSYPVFFREVLVVAGDIHDGLPDVGRLVGHIELQIARDLVQSREVLDPFNKAGHPVDRISDTAEHSSNLFSESGRVSRLSDDPGIFTSTALRRIDDQRPLTECHPRQAAG